MGFPGGSAVKNPPADAGDAGGEIRSPGRKAPLEEETATRSSILAGEPHGQRSLAGSSPQPRCDPPELASLHDLQVPKANGHCLGGQDGTTPAGGSGEWEEQMQEDEEASAIARGFREEVARQQPRGGAHEETGPEGPGLQAGLEAGVLAEPSQS